MTIINFTTIRFLVDRINKTITVPGVDYGGQVKLIHDEESYQVWAIPGGSYWSGYCNKYGEAYLKVVKIIGVDGSYFIGKQIKDIPTGKQWKKIRQATIEEVKNMPD